jgi:hypothetical protein
MLQHNEIETLSKTENVDIKGEEELKTSMNELSNAFTASEVFLISKTST